MYTRVHVYMCTRGFVFVVYNVDVEHDENTKTWKHSEYQRYKVSLCCIKGDDGSISVTSSARPIDGRHDTPSVPCNATPYVDGCQWTDYLSTFFDGIIDAAKNRELYSLALFHIMAWHVLSALLSDISKCRLMSSRFAVAGIVANAVFPISKVPWKCSHRPALSGW